MSFGFVARSIARTFNAHPVLRSIDLEVPSGTTTALIGPSAAGKSVLVRCLLGLSPADAGHVEVAGRSEPSLAGHRDRIGVLFQRNALFDSMTVCDNVAFRLVECEGWPRRRARELARDLLAGVGLPGTVAVQFPSELSGGMQKRAALARALVGDPDLLILDDPTAGLDPVRTTAILDLIDTHRARTGATVLAVTGDMKVARNRFDRIALLHDGIIRWAGTAAAAADSDNPWLEQMLAGRPEGPIRSRVRA